MLSGRQNRLNMHGNESSNSACNEEIIKNWNGSSTSAHRQLSASPTISPSSAALISAQLAPHIILEEKEKIPVSQFDHSLMESSRDSMMGMGPFGAGGFAVNVSSSNGGSGRKMNDRGDPVANPSTYHSVSQANHSSFVGNDWDPGSSNDKMASPFQGSKEYSSLEAVHYASGIPPLPEPNPQRKLDQNRLREIRKKLDGHFSPKDLETAYSEIIDDVVDLSTDYIGNTVVQRLIERCGDPQRLRIIELLAPHMAAIGIHKNGTWVIQKMIDYARTGSQMELIVSALNPLTPPLLLDQFGNYVVQCCLRLGSSRNQFVFDAMTAKCWEIAQGRFGARAMRACLESQFTSKKQQVRCPFYVPIISDFFCRNK
jgi:hypothetical protein